MIPIIHLLSFPRILRGLTTDWINWNYALNHNPKKIIWKRSSTIIIAFIPRRYIVYYLYRYFYYILKSPSVKPEQNRSQECPKFHFQCYRLRSACNFRSLQQNTNFKSPKGKKNSLWEKLSYYCARWKTSYNIRAICVVALDRISGSIVNATAFGEGKNTKRPKRGPIHLSLSHKPHFGTFFIRLRCTVVWPDSQARPCRYRHRLYVIDNC